LKVIFRREGVRGFYQGYTPHLFGTCLAQFFYIFSFEFTRDQVGAGGLGSFVAGGLSSALVFPVQVPLDVITQRICTQERSCKNNPYKGVTETLRHLLKNEGISGLYRGFGISLIMYW